MYGKYVTMSLPEGIDINVWVWCTPYTSQSELEKRALIKLRQTIDAKLDTDYKYVNEINN